MSPPTRRVGPTDRADSRNASSTTYQSDLHQRTAALHASAVFTEAIITTAIYGITGRLSEVEALEQVVRLGGRVERLIQAVAA